MAIPFPSYTTRTNQDDLNVSRIAFYNQAMAQYSANATNATIRKMLINHAVQSIVSLHVQSIAQEAAQQVSGSVATTIGQFAQALGGSVTRSRRGRIKELYTEAAQEALRSIESAYKRRPHKTRASSEGKSYREEYRDSGGKLLAAIKSPQMYRVSRDGVEFINPVWLDSQARQWYRLNYGAGGRGSASPTRSPSRMKLFGETLPGDVGLNGGPSAAFFLPPGFWSSTYPRNTPVPWDPSSKGQDFFILGGIDLDTYRKIQRPSRFFRAKTTPTLGITATRYLDAGVKRLMETMGAAQTKLMSEWLDEARRGSGPFVKTVNVTRYSVDRNQRYIQGLIKNIENSRVSTFYGRL